MARPLAKSPFVLLALFLWILECPASLAKGDDPIALNQQVTQLIEQRKYQEAISIAERAVEVAKRIRGPEHPETAEALNSLGFLFKKIGGYTKAEPLLQKALRIRQKVLGPEHADTANSLNNLGDLYEDMGEYAKAEPLLQEGLQIFQKVLGPEHSKTVTSLNNLGVLYEDMGEYAKAEPLFQKALRIRQKVLGSEHPDTVAILNNLAAVYWATGEYNKAEPLYREALRIWQNVLGPEHPDVATCLDNLGVLYQAMGEYAKAEPLLQEALRIRQKIFGPEHPDTTNSLNNLAALYEDMGEYAKAEPLYQEALRIRQKVFGSEHADTALSLNNLAELYEDMGEYVKAEPLYQEALRIKQQVLGPEHPDTAASLDNLANLYDDMGEYPKAEPLYQEALRIRQKALGSEHPDTAHSLNNLAALYKAMGEYAKAEPLFQEALRIRQKALGSEHPDTAHSLNNLAWLYEAMGEYAKAEPLYQEALRINRKVRGEEHPDTAASLSNLAALYEATGEYVKAEPLYQESLRIRQKVLGSEHPDTARSLNNLGVLYEDMGEYARAEPLYQQSLHICQKVLGSKHPDTAASLNNLAALYRAMGEYAKAEPLYQEALQIWQNVLGPEHPDTATSLDNLAYLEFDLGRIDKAMALTRRASAAKLKILSKIFSFTSEQQRLAYLDIFNPYSLFPFLKGTEADLAAAVLRYKGVVLDSIVEDRLLAEASLGSEDQRLVEQLNLDKRQLGQLLLQPAQKLSAESNQRIEALEGEVEKIEGQLAQHVAGLGQARHALGVSLEQVQQAIPNDGALVEYLRYDQYLGKNQWEECYGAIVLFSKGGPLWIPLGKANDIESLVRRYGALVRSSPQEDELSANLQALYEALWAPIGQALPSETKRIIISPDGQLNFISFATLLTKDKQFLAEKYDVQYVASGRDLLRELKPASDSSPAIVFAAPDFNLSWSQTVADGTSKTSIGVMRGNEKTYIEDLSFPPLAGTETERAKLTRIFVDWRTETISLGGKDATKEALFRIHSPYILHLATHGFFASEDESDTGPTELHPVSLQTSVFKSKFFNNPMHRSGLALAGAQATLRAWKRDEVPSVENDGILTAEDVSTLDLQGTWLVTLSACDTGSGEARAGEGVMGLRRGFIQAGAQNLLMTLWPISDEVTVQISGQSGRAIHYEFSR